MYVAVMFICFPAQVVGILYGSVLVPSFILVCIVWPCVFFSVWPFIFHCIFPSSSGTPFGVVIVAVMLLFVPAVIVGLLIFMVGFCFVTVICRVIFVLPDVIVTWYFPVFVKVCVIIASPFVILVVVVLFCIVIIARPVCILLLFWSVKRDV